MIKSREAGRVTAPTRVHRSRKYHSPTGIAPPASSVIDSRTITTAATSIRPAKIRVNPSVTYEHSCRPSARFGGTQNVDRGEPPLAA